MAKTTRFLYADFETIKPKLPKEYDTYKDYYAMEKSPKFPQVYSWGVGYKEKRSGKNKRLTDKFNPSTFNKDFVVHKAIGNDDSFLEFIETIEEDCTMYFNNLRGFDGHFIIPMLDRNGYINIIPLKLTEIKTVQDEEVREVYLKRFVHIKNLIMKQKAVAEKYSEIVLKDGIKPADKWIMKLVEKRWNKLLPYEYSLLADKNKRIFEIKIGLASNKTTNKIKRNRALIIRDNLNLFPASIKNMGEMLFNQYHGKCDCYNKKFEDMGESKCKDVQQRINLQKLYLKKELEGGYDRYELYKNYKEFENDGNQLEYLMQDVFILYAFHNEIEKYFPRKEWQMTIGSTSYKNWIKTLGNKMLKNAVKQEIFKEVILKRGAKRYVLKDGKEEKMFTSMSAARFLVEKIIPVKWQEYEIAEGRITHDQIFDWMFGGMSFVNEDYRGKLVKNLMVLDENSEYPSVMASEQLVPYGKPMEGDHKDYPFKFYELHVKNKITNQNGLPFLHNVNYEKRVYLKTLKPFTEYKFTSITLPYFLKYYNPKPEDYELKVVKSFKQMPVKEIFGDYILGEYEIKENAAKDGNEILKYIAKLNMNSLYGKQATKSLRESVVWKQEEQEWMSYVERSACKFYLPLGVVITEMARMDLVKAVGNNYKQVVGGDTDSLFIENFEQENFPSMEMHETKLGTWDIEFSEGIGIFRRPKQYLFIRENDEKYKVAFAGINFNRFELDDTDGEEVELDKKIIEGLDLRHFIIGREIENQTSITRLAGTGIIINSHTKHIKPIWDYPKLPEQYRYKPEHFMQTLNEILKLKKKGVKLTYAVIKKEKRKTSRRNHSIECRSRRLKKINCRRKSNSSTRDRRFRGS